MMERATQWTKLNLEAESRLHTRLNRWQRCQRMEPPEPPYSPHGTGHDGKRLTRAEVEAFAARLKLDV